MRRLYLSFAALLLGAVASCSLLEPTHSTQRTLLIQDRAEECIGESYQLCLLVKAPDEPTFTRHYGGIEGFQYEWGYRYEIEVEEHRVENPPMDGSSIRTVLRRQSSKERVVPGTEFEIFLTAGEGRVVEVAADRYRFYQAAEFSCSAGRACAELQSEIAAGARIRYRFQHPAAPTLPLMVVEWEVCDRALAGSQRCRS